MNIWVSDCNNKQGIYFCPIAKTNSSFHLLLHNYHSLFHTAHWVYYSYLARMIMVCTCPREKIKGLIISYPIIHIEKQTILCVSYMPIVIQIKRVLSVILLCTRKVFVQFTPSNPSEWKLIVNMKSIYHSYIETKPSHYGLIVHPHIEKTMIMLNWMDWTLIQNVERLNLYQV